MRREWKGKYHRELQRRASERGRRGANVRWRRDRENRARLDTLDPIRVDGKIKERLIRIVDEERVIERTFFEFDRICDWKRKRREVLA